MPYRTADPDAAPDHPPVTHEASRNHQRNGGASRRIAVRLLPGGVPLLAEVQHV
jgi:hypothetical protein